MYRKYGQTYKAIYAESPLLLSKTVQVVGFVYWHLHTWLIDLEAIGMSQSARELAGCCRALVSNSPSASIAQVLGFCCKATCIRLIAIKICECALDAGFCRPLSCLMIATGIRSRALYCVSVSYWLTDLSFSFGPLSKKPHIFLLVMPYIFLLTLPFLWVLLTCPPCGGNIF